MAVSCLKHPKKRAKLTEFKKQEANFSGASSHFSSSLTNLLSRKKNKNLQRKHNADIQKQFFPLVLFIVPYKMVLTFKSVDEMPWCNLSNESY